MNRDDLTTVPCRECGQPVQTYPPEDGDNESHAVVAPTTPQRWSTRKERVMPRENIHAMDSESLAALMQRDQFQSYERRAELWQAFQVARAREVDAKRVPAVSPETLLAQEAAAQFAEYGVAERLVDDLLNGGAKRKAELATANRTERLVVGSRKRLRRPLSTGSRFGRSRMLCGRITVCWGIMPGR